MRDFVEQLVDTFYQYEPMADNFGILKDMHDMGYAITEEADISARLHKLAFQSSIIGLIMYLADTDNDEEIAKLIKQREIDQIMDLINH